MIPANEFFDMDEWQAFMPRFISILELGTESPYWDTLIAEISNAEIKIINENTKLRFFIHAKLEISEEDCLDETYVFKINANNQCIDKVVAHEAGDLLFNTKGSLRLMLNLMDDLFVGEPILKEYEHHLTNINKQEIIELCQRSLEFKKIRDIKIRHIHELALSALDNCNHGPQDFTLRMKLQESPLQSSFVTYHKLADELEKFKLIFRIHMQQHMNCSPNIEINCESHCFINGHKISIIKEIIQSIATDHSNDHSKEIHIQIQDKIIGEDGQSLIIPELNIHIEINQELQSSKSLTGKTLNFFTTSISEFNRECCDKISTLCQSIKGTFGNFSITPGKISF